MWTTIGTCCNNPVIPQADRRAERHARSREATAKVGAEWRIDALRTVMV
jgi:hypothetical protein